jgi:hypothetical protein
MKAGEFTLNLADGTRLILCPGDQEAVRAVTFLARAARLSPAPSALALGARRLLITAGAVQEGFRSSIGEADDIHYPLETPSGRNRRRYRGPPDVEESPNDYARLSEEQRFWLQLLRLSACVSRETHLRGGVLLHSGLAVFGFEDRFGVLLAGRSGIGKSTACRRLPPPWRALADDVTLVVRDERGLYLAHPWPTWSRFFGEEAGDGRDSWDVQYASPLSAIFFLEHGEKDRVEPMGSGHAVSLLTELSGQISTEFLRGLARSEVVAYNLQRFENICALARVTPAYLLSMRLDGEFWKEMERVLGVL